MANVELNPGLGGKIVSTFTDVGGFEWQNVIPGFLDAGVATGVTNLVGLPVTVLGGNLADDTPDGGNPTKVGARAVATPAAVVDNSRVDLTTDLSRRLRTTVYEVSQPLPAGTNLLGNVGAFGTVADAAPATADPVTVGAKAVTVFPPNAPDGAAVDLVTDLGRRLWTNVYTISQPLPAGTNNIGTVTAIPAVPGAGFVWVIFDLEAGMLNALIAAPGAATGLVIKVYSLTMTAYGTTSLWFTSGFTAITPEMLLQSAAQWSLVDQTPLFQTLVDTDSLALSFAGDGVRVTGLIKYALEAP